MKFVALLAFTVTVMVTRGYTWALGCLGAAVLVALVARVKFASRFVVFAVLGSLVTGAYQWWTRGPEVGVNVGADLLAIMLAALAVAAHTSPHRVMASVTRAARLLKPFGIDPGAVGLTISLVLTAVPRLSRVADEVQAAARARGLERSPRARLVPLAIRAVASAKTTGKALAARGLAS